MCVCAPRGPLRLHPSRSESISHSAASPMRLVRDGYFVSLHPSSEFCLLSSCTKSESLNYNPQIKHKQDRPGSHSYAAVSGASITCVYLLLSLALLYLFGFVRLSSRLAET